jgi:hypothetical protein
LTSPSSQRSYDHAIREFIDWYCPEPRLAFNKTVVTRYRISLEQANYASSTINLRLGLSAALHTRPPIADSPDLAAGIRDAIEKITDPSPVRPVASWQQNIPPEFGGARFRQG